METSREELIINEEPVDLDGLNYLAGKTVDFINKSAMNGTILAHTDGQRAEPDGDSSSSRTSSISDSCSYFFEFACGVSGYLLGVNPFNQASVESYKKEYVRTSGANRVMKKKEKNY